MIMRTRMHGRTLLCITVGQGREGNETNDDCIM